MFSRSRPRWPGAVPPGFPSAFWFSTFFYSPAALPAFGKLRSPSSWTSSSWISRYPKVSGPRRGFPERRLRGGLGFFPVAVTDRVSTPLLEGLAGEFQYPAGHQHRHPHKGFRGGQFKDQREHHFGLMSWERYSTARRITSASCSRSLMRFFASRSSTDSSFVTPAATPPWATAIFNHRCRARGKPRNPLQSGQ